MPVTHEPEQGSPDLTLPGWQGFVYISEAIDSLGDRAEESVPPSTGLEGAVHIKVFPLSTMQAGDRVRIISLNCGDADSRLMGMGLMPGVVLQVINCTAGGSVMIALQDQRLGLGAEMAHHIQVADAAQVLDIPPNPLTARTEPMSSTPDTPTAKLRDAAIGTQFRVLGYEPIARDYKRKLLAMGLTPGTEFRVTRHAPLGDPTEIEVRGFHLSLRKDEADALVLQPISSAL